MEIKVNGKIYRIFKVVKMWVHFKYEFLVWWVTVKSQASSLSRKVLIFSILFRCKAADLEDDCFKKYFEAFWINGLA